MCGRGGTLQPPPLLFSKAKLKRVGEEAPLAGHFGSSGSVGEADFPF